jgi:hypothetical protein
VPPARCEANIPVAEHSSRPLCRRSRWGSSPGTWRRPQRLQPGRFGDVSGNAASRSSAVTPALEEQRAAVGLLDPPGLRRQRPGERAALVAEELGLEEGLRQRAAVQRDEGAALPGAAGVNGPSHQLLAGPGLAAASRDGAESGRAVGTNARGTPEILALRRRELGVQRARSPGGAHRQVLDRLGARLAERDSVPSRRITSVGRAGSGFNSIAFRLIASDRGHLVSAPALEIAVWTTLLLIPPTFLAPWS